MRKWKNYRPIKNFGHSLISDLKISENLNFGQASIRNLNCPKFLVINVVRAKTNIKTEKKQNFQP